MKSNGHSLAIGLAAALAALAASAAATPALAGAAPMATVHNYVIRVDAGLGTMHVEANFARAVASITARSHDAGRYLTDFRNCDPTPQIRMRNQRMILPVDGIRCMSYTVDLRAAAAGERDNRALAGDNAIVSPSLWLWRPAIDDDTELRVRFDLPPGIAVAVPWQRAGDEPDTYRITRSPESASAPAAFGRFDYREIRVPGAILRVSLMQPVTPMNDEAILNWVQAAATDVSLAYGRFPNPSPQVVVIPVGDSGRGSGAVPFGRVVRDGGETVELFVNQQQPLEAFLDDWTATHEFSHLMLPYLDRQHRWISEGFAQYYQNVLLARSGAYDPQRTWQKLYEGFERGRRSRPELSPNDAAARRGRGTTMKVYWSGAALALMADVELRRQSGGRETLDQVLMRLQSCCLPSARTWTGPELFTTLDSLAGKPVFMPLYRRYADTSGFPDTAPLLAELGLQIEDGRVELRRNGRLGNIRGAITELHPATAHWREQLAASAR